MALNDIVCIGVGCLSPRGLVPAKLPPTSGVDLSGAKPEVSTALQLAEPHAATSATCERQCIICRISSIPSLFLSITFQQHIESNNPSRALPSKTELGQRPTLTTPCEGHRSTWVLYSPSLFWRFRVLQLCGLSQHHAVEQRHALLYAVLVASFAAALQLVSHTL